MTRIAFIGLGNMGGGMAANQARAGHEVLAFDLSAAALQKAVAAGCQAAGSAAAAVQDADAVITMLPAGQHVRAVYANEILPNARSGALLIDCSTIDVESARAVGIQAKTAGFRFADAPVSGGQAGAEAGTLAFMVGCDEPDFAAVEGIIGPMPRITLRPGDHGAGQASTATTWCWARRCDLRGLRACREVGSGAVRDRVQSSGRAGPDQLLPRLAWCRPRPLNRTKGGRHGDDAEGPETRQRPSLQPRLWVAQSRATPGRFGTRLPALRSNNRKTGDRKFQLLYRGHELLFWIIDTYANGAKTPEASRGRIRGNGLTAKSGTPEDKVDGLQGRVHRRS